MFVVHYQPQPQKWYSSKRRIEFIIIAVSLIAVCVKRYAISIKVCSVCELHHCYEVKIILRGIGRDPKCWSFSLRCVHVPTSVPNFFFQHILGLIITNSFKTTAQILVPAELILFILFSSNRVHCINAVEPYLVRFKIFLQTLTLFATECGSLPNIY